MKRTLLIWACSVILALILAAAVSCNVTRSTTTTAQYLQRGDTIITITTKTTEVVDGKVHVKPSNN